MSVPSALHPSTRVPAVTSTARTPGRPPNPSPPRYLSSSRSPPSSLLQAIVFPFSTRCSALWTPLRCRLHFVAGLLAMEEQPTSAPPHRPHRASTASTPSSPSSTTPHDVELHPRGLLLPPRDVHPAARPPLPFPPLCKQRQHNLLLAPIFAVLSSLAHHGRGLPRAEPFRGGHSARLQRPATTTPWAARSRCK
jgi:hypothetical protein